MTEINEAKQLVETLLEDNPKRISHIEGVVRLAKEKVRSASDGSYVSVEDRYLDIASRYGKENVLSKHFEVLALLDKYGMEIHSK